MRIATGLMGVGAIILSAAAGLAKSDESSPPLAEPTALHSTLTSQDPFDPLGKQAPVDVESRLKTPFIGERGKGDKDKGEKPKETQGCSVSKTATVPDHGFETVQYHIKGAGCNVACEATAAGCYQEPTSEPPSGPCNPNSTGGKIRLQGRCNRECWVRLFDEPFTSDTVACR